MSLDRKHCLTQCGLHQKPVDKQCVDETCTENDVEQKGHCECDTGYLITEDSTACKLPEQCRRTQVIDEVEVCLDGPCKYGWKAPISGKVCVETCPAWVYNA